MGRIFQKISMGLLVAATALFTSIGLMASAIPNDYYITSDVGLSSVATRWISPSGDSVAQVLSSGDTRVTTMSLLGCIPVKTVTVEQTQQKTVQLCAAPFGIKMYTQGVVVVGTNPIETKNGTENPGDRAGLCKGDVVTAVDGTEIRDTNHFKELLQSMKQDPVVLTVTRKNMSFTLRLIPAQDVADGMYKAGLWVRDSSAGIGTMTYYDPIANCFGGLGHGVCDVDTGNLLPLSTGEVVSVHLTGIVKGGNGVAGELHGVFSSETIGQLTANTASGVFGTGGEALSVGDPLPVALKQEIVEGPCQIVTTLDDEGPKYYDARIRSIDYGGGATKNMVITVTDETLIEKTGGIVRGMSGSPIVQNGKLIGAVTHVFVGDSTTGYGIFAENMLSVKKD